MNMTLKYIVMACGAMMAAAGTANASLVNVATAGLANPTCALGCALTEFAQSVTSVPGGTSSLSYTNDYMLSKFDLPSSVAYPVIVAASQTDGNLKHLDAKIYDVTTSTVLTTVTDITAHNTLNFVYTGPLVNTSDQYAIAFKDTCTVAARCTASSLIVTVSQIDITPTPLPGALLLFGSVLAGAGAFVRRRRIDA